jgi:hypothetical protein
MEAEFTRVPPLKISTIIKAIEEVEIDEVEINEYEIDEVENESR